MNILLVEDNQGDICMIREALKEIHVYHSLHVVNDGDEAVDFLFRRNQHRDAPRPDLILLDLHLPGKSGREVILEIGSDPVVQNIPLVVLTTSTCEYDAIGGRILSRCRYMVKPLEFSVLVVMMKEVQRFWASALACG